MNSLRSIFLVIALIRIKLLEIPREYAVSSIKPNGDKKRIASGGTASKIGVVVVIAANANPDVFESFAKFQSLDAVPCQVSSMIHSWLRGPRALASRALRALLEG